MNQFPGIHGNHDFGFCGIRQYISGVFSGNTRIDHLGIQLVKRPQLRLIPFPDPGVRRYAGGNNGIKTVLVGNISLGLLGERGEAVAHQLVRSYPGYPFQAERE